MIRYNGLYSKLAEKGITKTDLSKELGISSKTIAKIARGEKLSKATLQKIAGFLPPFTGYSDKLTFKH